MRTLEKIAVLIDADNTQLAKVELAIQDISTRGRIVVKRAYGNWKKDNLRRWEEELKRLAIKAEQQFDYVAGKNATDMALVIDAIELLYSGSYDAFALMASDSDYTPLAIKLHESGVYVFGVGEKKTPESFRNACDEFIFLENLEPRTAGKVQAAAPASEEQGSMEDIHALLHKAWETYQEEDGFVFVSAAGQFLKRAKPDFDARTYGYAKMSQLLEAFPDRYVMRREEPNGVGAAAILSYSCK